MTGPRPQGDSEVRRRGDDLQSRGPAILESEPLPEGAGEVIGRSRDDRPIRALRVGSGPRRVSLLAGCHADEPVGPRLLRRLAAYLTRLSREDPLLRDYAWWILPHINPDGAARNADWQSGDPDAYDLVGYLLSAVREEPGEDIEFGFPRGPNDDGARPENRAAYDWWCRAEGPFALHASLHGMAYGAGPWFLIEPAWRERYDRLKQRVVARVQEWGYRLHDVERRGEKGFFRLERGFCTRPDSRYMRQHFIDLGDDETAGRFRPSSMETIRALGGDPLTLVSELPLFITPGVGELLEPSDPVAEAWKLRTEAWQKQLLRGADPRHVREDAAERGLRSMPVGDQMRLLWAFIAGGLEQVELIQYGGRKNERPR